MSSLGLYWVAAASAVQGSFLRCQKPAWVRFVSDGAALASAVSDPATTQPESRVGIRVVGSGSVALARWLWLGGSGSVALARWALARWLWLGGLWLGGNRRCLKTRSGDRVTTSPFFDVVGAGLTRQQRKLTAGTVSLRVDDVDRREELRRSVDSETSCCL
ncbi:hypothetical protein BU23DRAFT_566248 [Bimuria novae-zelandiae CBS 107.79]|uniref:Uncharacterized protein n=1 Tax=Bimuria novae-zelandiae CBS 107.79 TaxID=1447943 RepID=A0A6A5VG79_9PLEO|nr:hypothetical protein BU23DRAFT_566248 [Bimuria novae-zelandiae CBS 107.79]